MKKTILLVVATTAVTVTVTGTPAATVTTAAAIAATTATTRTVAGPVPAAVSVGRASGPATVAITAPAAAVTAPSRPLLATTIAGRVTLTDATLESGIGTAGLVPSVVPGAGASTVLAATSTTKLWGLSIIQRAHRPPLCDGFHSSFPRLPSISESPRLQVP